MNALWKKVTVLLMAAAVMAIPVTVSAEEGDLDEVTLVLPRPAECLDDVDFIVADEVGYFEENGLKVNVEVATGTSDMQMVVMGKGEVCFPDPDVMLLGMDGGMEVIGFYQRDTIAENCIVVKNDSDIKELKDIEGKSIAVGDAAWSVCIDPILTAAGVDASTVEYVVAGEDRAQMVLADKVDAAFSWEKGYQLWQAQGLDLRPISFFEFVNMPGNPLVTAKANLESNPDLYQRFSRAMAQAEYFVECNPEAATQMVLDRFPSIDVSLEDGVEVIKAAVRLWTSADGFEEHGYGYIDDSAWEECIKYAKECGFVTGDYTAADCYTNQFVEGANDFDREKVEADAANY